MNAANHHGREAACWTVDHFSMAKAIRLRVRTQTHTLSRYTWTEWRSVEPASLLHRHVRWANFVTNSQKFHYGKFAKAFHRDFKIPVFAVEDCWRARWLAAWQAGARKPKKLLATGVAYALMTLPVCLFACLPVRGHNVVWPNFLRNATQMNRVAPQRPTSCLSDWCAVSLASCFSDDKSSAYWKLQTATSCGIYGSGAQAHTHFSTINRSNQRRFAESVYHAAIAGTWTPFLTFLV